MSKWQLVPAFVIALLGAVPAAGAWADESLVSPDGACRVSIPPDWAVDLTYHQAASPDRASEVRWLGSDAVTSLAEAKATNAAVFRPVKTFEETAQRLWYQYAPYYQNDNGWYVAVPRTDGVCSIQISFHGSVISAANEAAAKQIALSLQPAAPETAGAPAAPAEAASDDPFVGTWQADLSTVPAQQPPLKGITLAVSAATDGYQFHEVDTLDQPGTGVAQMTADTPIRLTGKAYAVDLGYTLTCERGAARTIHCLAQMSGQTLYDERLVVGADAGTLTQTMKGPDESGQEVQVVTVYHKG